MLFFSEILKAHIVDSLNIIDGKAIDALIRVEKDVESPEIIGLVIKNQGKKQFIPTAVITEWDLKKIKLNKTLKEATTEIPSGEDIVSLNNAILDKQIVDLDGLRVVRVNDLQFGNIQQKMCLIAIDISNRGLLRRFGVNNRHIDQIFKSHFLEWKNIHSLADKLQLSTGVKEMIKLHPADIANVIEKMNINHATAWLQSLDKVTAAKVLEEVQPDIQKVLVKSLGPERAATLLEKMSVNELVDLIQLLPSDQSQEIINKLPQDTRIKHVQKILDYDEDTAGGLMTTEFIAVLPESTVSQVIEEIKNVSPNFSSIHYVYVTDSNGKLLGVTSIRNLIVAKSDQTIKEIMRGKEKLPVASVNQGLNSLASLMTKYNLLTVAVVDGEKRIIGIVTVDDIMRRLIPDA